MTREKEQLRQQLELLAELSKTADERDAPCITSAMCEIYDRLEGNRLTIPFCVTVFLDVYRTAIVYRVTPEFTYTGDYGIVQDNDSTITDFSNWKGNWKIRFLTSGTFRITNRYGWNGKIDAFLVGAGGSGNSGYGSGGGSGYTKTVKGLTLTENTDYHIIIGAGGIGVSTLTGNTGGSTSAFSNTASGGTGGETRQGGRGGSGGGSVNGTGGSDGSNGANGAYTGGTGQGSTTREFGESGAKLYAGGGGGENAAGGDGGGAAGGFNSREALIKAHYNRVCRGNQRQQAKDEAILGGK